MLGGGTQQLCCHSQFIRIAGRINHQICIGQVEFRDSCQRMSLPSFFDHLSGITGAEYHVHGAIGGMDMSRLAMRDLCQPMAVVNIDQCNCIVTFLIKAFCKTDMRIVRNDKTVEQFIKLLSYIFLSKLI